MCKRLRLHCVSSEKKNLLEEILLRLDDTANLARASAACASFHHVVSDGRFRRRFRSLNRPPVLGFLGCGMDYWGLNFYPAAPPRQAAPAARALARAADFYFSFSSTLPKPADVRDSRVLFCRPIVKSVVFDSIVVYDPLHRRHVKIPPIPNDLLATPGHGLRRYHRCF